MRFRTEIEITAGEFRIDCHERLLCVGSCFADNIGRRFRDDRFDAVVNPHGVMYNPVSVLHSVEKTLRELSLQSLHSPDVVLITLGTNHVYRLNETGEVVDNCEKRPQRLFTEEMLTIDECVDNLQKVVNLLTDVNPRVRIVLTVSPIRYAKYGFHGSQLSKSTLLLAADRLCKTNFNCFYFPAYEIVNDELRDYRFYSPDMLHPSEQTVDYIYDHFSSAYLSDEAKRFVNEWRPIKAALDHRPFNPESEEYQTFKAAIQSKLADFEKKYRLMPYRKE